MRNLTGTDFNRIIALTLNAVRKASRKDVNYMTLRAMLRCLNKGRVLANQGNTYEAWIYAKAANQFWSMVYSR